MSLALSYSNVTKPTKKGIAAMCARERNVRSSSSSPRTRSTTLLCCRVVVFCRLGFRVGVVRASWACAVPRTLVRRLFLFLTTRRACGRAAVVETLVRTLSSIVKVTFCSSSTVAARPARSADSSGYMHTRSDVLLCVVISCVVLTFHTYFTLRLRAYVCVHVNVYIVFVYSTPM